MVKPIRKKTYHGYETRLETFSSARLQGAKPRSRRVTWPHAQPSANEVAKAGFYFTPAPGKYGGDLVTCYMCGCGIDGWEPTDNPLQVHISNCKNCPLAILQARAWEEEEDVHDPRDEETLSVRLQTYYQPLTNEELEQALIQENEGDEETPRKNKLTSSSLMLMGTSVWPHDTKRGWLPTSENMAKAGFYYFPNHTGEDFGLCPYCNLGLDGWEPNDDPVLEHKQRSPECLFFTANSTEPLAKSVRKGQRQVEEKYIISDDEDDLVPTQDYNSDSDATASSSSSNKRKKQQKKSTARKKRNSQGSQRSSSVGISDSDGSSTASASSATGKKRRGRPRKNPVAGVGSSSDFLDSVMESARKKPTMVVGPSKMSPNSKSFSEEGEDELGALSSVLRGANILSKGSVSAKISRFEVMSGSPDRSPERSPERKIDRSKSATTSRPAAHTSPILSYLTPQLHKPSKFFDADESVQSTASVHPASPGKLGVTPDKLDVTPGELSRTRLDNYAEPIEISSSPMKAAPSSPVKKDLFKLPSSSPSKLDYTENIPSANPSTENKNTTNLKTEIPPLQPESSIVMVESSPVASIHASTPNRVSSPIHASSPIRASTPVRSARKDMAESSRILSPKPVSLDISRSKSPPKSWVSASATAAASGLENRSDSPALSVVSIPPPSIYEDYDLAPPPASAGAAKMLKSENWETFSNSSVESLIPTHPVTGAAMPLPLRDASPHRSNTPPPAVIADKLKTPARQVPPQHQPVLHMPSQTWVQADPDMVFELLPTLPHGSTGGTGSNRAKLTALDQHMHKTVREYFTYLADESEARSRAHFDHLAGLIQTEAQRAIVVLQNLPVRN